MIKYDNTDVKLRAEALDEIWWQGRQWAVTAFGIECRDGTYTIEANRLSEMHNQNYSWIEHVGEKDWVDVDDFATVYFVACALHGKRLTRAERAMLAKHHAKAKKEELRRPYFQKAKEALGIPDRGYCLNLMQFDELCAKADELSEADGL
jgi:hypothetical protein